MYKYLLVPATGSSTDAVVFETAFRVAQPFASHIEFLHVRADVTGVVVSLSTGGIGGGGAVQGVVEQLEAESRAIEAAARAGVVAFCAAHAIALGSGAPADALSAEFTVEVGSDAQWVAECGRFADLVVLGRAQPGQESAAEVLETALMDTGRPLLIAARVAPENLLGTIVIAWKDTPEAARAVVAAMPLLERAAKVLILTVNEEDKAVKADCERLRHALGWHTRNLELRCLSRGRRRPVDVLLEEATRENAGLIVMGGYSHSRLHEVVFGGFTSQILAGIDIPVLIAH